MLKYEIKAAVCHKLNVSNLEKKKKNRIYADSHNTMIVTCGQSQLQQSFLFSTAIYRCPIWHTNIISIHKLSTLRKHTHNSTKKRVSQRFKNES